MEERLRHEKSFLLENLIQEPLGIGRNPDFPIQSSEHVVKTSKPPWVREGNGGAAAARKERAPTRSRLRSRHVLNPHDATESTSLQVLDSP